MPADLPAICIGGERWGEKGTAEIDSCDEVFE